MGIRRDTNPDERPLGPVLRERLQRLLPGTAGARAAWARRALAGLLFLTAGVLALQPAPGSAAAGTTVVVAAGDLAPGAVLSPADIAERRVPARLVPEGALRETGSALGRVLGGAARHGEVLTDVRLAGPELTRLATGGPGHASVPVRLADAGIAELLHPGRRVDVIAAGGSAGRPDVLAERVPVLAVRPAEENRRGRLVVVGLPEDRAHVVAAASLSRSVTVALR